MMCDKFDVINSNMPLKKLLQQKEEIEAEVESLCNMMYTMNKARLKYESSLVYMSNSGFSQEERNRFSDNIYSQGDLGSSRMNFGRDYATQMDKEAAINNYASKIENIKMKLEVAQKLLSEKMLEREKLRKAAAKKALEERRREVNGGYHPSNGYKQ